MTLQFCRARLVFNAHFSSESKVGALNCNYLIIVLIKSTKFPISLLGFFPNTDSDLLEHSEATTYCNILSTIFTISCLEAPRFIVVAANELKVLLIRSLQIRRLDGVMIYDLSFR